jgi:hypothetical protein
MGSFIGGGGALYYPALFPYYVAYTNSISSDFGVVGGGLNNVIQTRAGASVIGGGEDNVVSAEASDASIGGGWGNSILEYSGSSVVAGGQQNVISTNQLLSCIVGGFHNQAGGGARQYFVSMSRDQGNAIGGGGGNYITEGVLGGTIAGGANNTVGTNALYATIPGGMGNLAAGAYSLAGGRHAQALHDGTFVWADSQSADFASTAANQFLIRASGGVGINKNNPASALDVNGTVTATSFAGTALNLSGGLSAGGGASITGDIQNSTPSGIMLDAANRPLITRGWDRFTSGSYTGIGRWGLFMEPFNLVLGIPGDDVPGRYFQVRKYALDGSFGNLMTVDQSGNLWTMGAVNPPSDRNVKTNFAAVDTAEVLAKVAALPIQTWNYKNDAEDVRHLGPVAQDFRAAFNLGADDKHIATVDADGVALAAIQGLNAKMEAENAELRAENAELKTRLERLEKIMEASAARR